MILKSGQWPEYIRKNFNKYKYVLLVCLAGLVLAAWPAGRTDGAGPKAQAAPALCLPETETLARSLEKTLEDMEGVGRLRVMLTVKSSCRSVYAYDLKTNESSRMGSDSTERSAEKQQNMVFSEGSAQTPVMVRTDGPQYQGAVIVCDGADSAAVRLALTEAVRALTGISSDCISIVKMKQ